MFRAMKLRQKEVINITDARRLGFVHDVEINENDGSLEAIIVPRRRLFGRIFGGEYIIPWDCIEAVSYTHLDVYKRQLHIPLTEGLYGDLQIRLSLRT